MAGEISYSDRGMSSPDWSLTHSSCCSPDPNESPAEPTWNPTQPSYISPGIKLNPAEPSSDLNWNPTQSSYINFDPKWNPTQPNFDSSWSPTRPSYTTLDPKLNPTDPNSDLRLNHTQPSYPNTNPKLNPTQMNHTDTGPKLNPTEQSSVPTEVSYPNPDPSLNITQPPSYTNPKRSWITPNTSWASPPDPLQVTHVNQTYDLIHSVPVSNVSSPTSKEWLLNHGIKALHLTFKDFVDKGKLVGPQADSSTGQASHYVAFNPLDIVTFQEKLKLTLKSYQQRINWLLQGSRKVFGVSSVKSVAVAVDCSDHNTGYGRLETLQKFLLQLIDEQLCKKSFLYLTSFGTETQPLWSTSQQVNPKTINGAKQWVQQLQPQDSCNMLQVLKDIAKLKNLDSVILILGSVPDQKPDILTEFAEQMFVGQDTTIDGVSYDCSNHLTNMCLRKLSEMTGGRFHCYSSCCEDLIYSGTDISLLVNEIRKVKDIINKIEASKQGMMGKAMVNIHDEVAADIQKLPQSMLLPKPAGHNSPLNIDHPKPPRQSSIEWLKQHGLKAKKLSLYHFLTPNAFNYQTHFVPVIGKTVQSQVHEKAMVQFQWHDGSVKNVHVDMAQMFEYQKQLGAAVGLYEQRMEWLSTGSRKIFGTISGQRVIILLDLSLYNINYLIHIQHSMRLLLQQQMHDKEYFNIISFGLTSRRWSETMKKPTEENLQSAWKWILASKCEGRRNFLSAFRMATENDVEIKNGIDPDAIYLFASGVPDQPEDICLPYITESCIGRGIHFHVSLFHVHHSGDSDDTAAPPAGHNTVSETAECLRNLAHCTQGRFHWFGEAGINESDDINCIMKEIEKALLYSKKCSQLMQAVKKKYQLKKVITNPKVLPICPATHPKRPASCISTLMNKEKTVVNERPTTSGRLTTAGRSLSSGRPVSCVKRPVSAGNKGSHSTVSATGSVLKRFPKAKAKVSKKAFSVESFEGIEDYVTTRQWLHRYSLSKQKLNLSKLLSASACKHGETSVKVLHRPVTAKYCNIFPSINVNGTLRHLQLMPHELQQYIKRLESLLKYYLHRMQWLLSGSRRVFGTVIHKHSTVLIDTSGSMNRYMDELKKELASLIWEQLYKNKAPFNFISFSSVCKSWQPSIQPATKENCQSAIEWFSKLEAAGSTCTLEALQMAFSDEKTKAIYLLTDGKPDSSRSLVLQQVKSMNEERKIPVNTISFNCSDSGANDFLKQLSQLTAGRYHKMETSFNVNLFIHKLLNEGFQDISHPPLPQFESDDLNRLSKEIELARTYLSQCMTYRDVYNNFQNSKLKPTAMSCFTAASRPSSLESEAKGTNTLNKKTTLGPAAPCVTTPGQTIHNQERQSDTLSKVTPSPTKSNQAIPIQELCADSLNEATLDPAILSVTTPGQAVLNPVIPSPLMHNKVILGSVTPEVTTPDQAIPSPEIHHQDTLKATSHPTIPSLAMPGDSIHNPIMPNPVTLNKATLSVTTPSQAILNLEIPSPVSLNKMKPGVVTLDPALTDPVTLREAISHSKGDKYQQNRRSFEGHIHGPKTNVGKYSELEL